MTEFSSPRAGATSFRVPMYRVLVVGIVLLYAVVFHISVPNICGQFAAQPAYRLCVPPNFSLVVWYTLLAMVPALFLPTTKTASSIIMFIVYVMHVFPFIAMYPYVPINDRLGSLLPLLAAISYSGLAVAISFVKFSLPRASIQRNHLIIVSLVAYLIAIATIYFSFDISFQLVSIFDVYDVRAEFKNQLLDAANPLAAYVVTVSAYALAPGMIVFSRYLLRESFVLALVFLGLALFLSASVYSLAAYKSGVFIAFFTLLISYGTIKFNASYTKYVLIGFGCFSIIVLLLALLHSDSPVFAHWYRRAFVVPGLNTNMFYNYIGNSLYQGEFGMAHLVSRLYYGGTGSANSGLYGDGMAKAGFAGVFFTVALFGLILKAMDATSSYLPPSMSAALFLPTGYALSNSSTTAVVLTYGGGVALLFAYLLNEHARRRGDRLPGWPSGAPAPAHARNGRRPRG